MKAHGLPVIAPFMLHILRASASALDDAGVPVYFMNTSDRGPDGKIYNGASYLVHNKVTDVNNPVSATLVANGAVISGNLPSRQNLYQITLVMRGLNLGPMVFEAGLFVDRLPYDPQQQQLITNDKVVLESGRKQVEFARYHAPALGAT